MNTHFSNPAAEGKSSTVRSTTEGSTLSKLILERTFKSASGFQLTNSWKLFLSLKIKTQDKIRTGGLLQTKSN